MLPLTVASTTNQPKAGHPVLEVRHGAFGMWPPSPAERPLRARFVREMTHDAGSHNENKYSGRGERASASLTQQSLRFLMINRTPRESLPATAQSA